MASQIGKIIKKYRKEKGFTQFQMAEKIGVSEFYISALETGNRKPGRETLIKLSNEMKMPIEALLELETEQSVKFAAEELYNKIKLLPNAQRKKVINIIEFIIDEFKDN